MANEVVANRRIRRLTPAEIESYDVLGSDLGRRVWLVKIPGLPGPYLGMTLGRIVLLVDWIPADGDSLLLAHELVHVRQWSELGVVGFGVRYLRDFFGGLARLRSWNRAYAQVELEEEARRLAGAWADRRRSPPEIGETPSDSGP